MNTPLLKIETRYNVPPGKITLREVCKLLHISESTAKRRIAAGEIKTAATHGRRKPVLFDLAYIRKLAGPDAPLIQYVPKQAIDSLGILTVNQMLSSAGRKGAA